ncbi:MAG: chemotaxis protein CheB [Thermoleophilaceae bacterium]
MSCDIVVIGASWGGLVALERSLGLLPEEFAPPIVIAQHRAPDLGSGALGDLLSAHLGRPVVEAGDKEPITAGRIYIAPPDYHLLIEPGAFALSTDAAVQYSRPSIDVLFDSAADAYGERTVAVVLTGANADGARGVSRVKRRGGYVIVQDPQTAERREMPDAAIATGNVDRLVELEEIAPLLVDLASVVDTARRAG